MTLLVGMFAVLWAACFALWVLRHVVGVRFGAAPPPVQVQSRGAALQLDPSGLRVLAKVAVSGGVAHHVSVQFTPAQVDRLVQRWAQLRARGEVS